MTDGSCRIFSAINITGKNIMSGFVKFYILECERHEHW